MIGATTSAGATSAIEALVVLAMYCVVAVVVYRSSNRIRLATGSTPWGLPTWLWVLAVLLFLPLSLVYLLAWVTASRQIPPRAGPWTQGQPGYG
ncbi:MAG: hypothetical protein M0Z63_10015, partial [Actinomycetota bacterium]|nr:hypothetical protein [Actinomycetota bacterium]